MASALMNGMVNKGVLKKADLSVSDVFAPTLEKHKAAGFATCSSNVEVVKSTKVVWLAVKPHYMAGVISEIASSITKDHLVISIAAGTTIGAIEAGLPKGTRVVRVMPNTPCLVGQMAAGFAGGKSATQDDIALVEKLLSSVGVACAVNEAQLDAVTGVSGSGPAYIFLAIEALADGGVRAGLPRAVALKLAAQTVRGAAQMQQETGAHPGVLKDQVMSPGGTTAAGVHALENGGFRSTLMNAVVATTNKATELGRPKPKL